MQEQDVYEQLADMINSQDIVGVPKTPSFLKILRLQLTPEEASLALHVGLGGARLEEISARTGISKSKLKKMLNTMADKGTIYIEPGKEDPVYRVVGSSAPGFTETGLWTNVRFPYTVELGKAVYQFLKEWSEEKLCKLGFPFAPVWAGVLALPEDASPSENLAEVIKEAGHWSVSPCPCRLSHWLSDPGNHCQHILETCLHLGDLSRWAVQHRMARELTYKEAVQLLRDCNENGLVHTLDINSVVCNCCTDCCAMFYGHKLGAKIFIPSPFRAYVDQETCTMCGTCTERCPVGAIMESEEHAMVDKDRCLGCGVCVPACTTNSIKLIRRS